MGTAVALELGTRTANDNDNGEEDAALRWRAFEDAVGRLGWSAGDAAALVKWGREKQPADLHAFHLDVLALAVAARDRNQEAGRFGKGGQKVRPIENVRGWVISQGNAGRWESSERQRQQAKQLYSARQAVLLGDYTPPERSGPTRIGDCLPPPPSRQASPAVLPVPESRP
jgi:hypothetical protein